MKIIFKDGSGEDITYYDMDWEVYEDILKYAKKKIKEDKESMN